MNSFAFLKFASDTGKAEGFWQRFFNKNKPFRVTPLKLVRCARSKTIEGVLLTSKSGQPCIEEVTAAAQYAQSLGAKILGVERCAFDFEDIRLDKKICLPISDGNFFTAWSAYEAVYRMGKARGLDLRRMNLVVLGAAGSLGKICARKFSGYVARTIICDTQQESLQKLKQEMLGLNPCAVTCETQVSRAIKEADAIIAVKDELLLFLNPRELKTNCIICDISIGKSLAKNTDFPGSVSIIDGGLIKMPFCEKIISASLAQVMLFTFERKFSNAFGDTANLDTVENVADMAAGHGFEVWVPQAPVL